MGAELRPPPAARLKILDLSGESLGGGEGRHLWWRKQNSKQEMGNSGRMCYRLVGLRAGSRG